MNIFRLVKDENIKKYKLFGKTFLKIESKDCIKYIYILNILIFKGIDSEEFLKRQNLQIRLDKLILNICCEPRVKITGELATLCDKYGSDKGSNFIEYNEFIHPYKWNPHTYSYIYEQIFANIRLTTTNVFECGLGTSNENILSNMTSLGKPGASLRVWRDYFPNANVYGVDIDKDILFSEERIHTAWIDQTSKEAVDTFFSSIDVKFDIMIDDGLHTSEAAICLFENSFKFLTQNGIYIIEDIYVSDMPSVVNYLKNRRDINYSCVMMDCPGMLDNNLIIITRALLNNENTPS